MYGSSKYSGDSPDGRKAYYYDTGRPSETFDAVDRKLLLRNDVLTSKNQSLIGMNDTYIAETLFAFSEVVFP